MDKEEEKHDGKDKDGEVMKDRMWGKTWKES